MLSRARQALKPRLYPVRRRRPHPYDDETPGQAMLRCFRRGDRSMVRTKELMALQNYLRDQYPPNFDLEDAVEVELMRRGLQR